VRPGHVDRVAFGAESSLTEVANARLILDQKDRFADGPAPAQLAQSGPAGQRRRVFAKRQLDDEP